MLSVLGSSLSAFSGFEGIIKSAVRRDLTVRVAF